MSLILSGSSSIIGPAVGGAIGGVAAISAIILVLFCVRRRTRSGDRVAIIPDPPTSISQAHSIGASQLPSYHGALAALALSTPATDQRPQSHPTPTVSPDPHVLDPTPTIPVTSSLPAQRISTVPSPILDAIASPQDSTIAADSALAAEEVRYLRDLYSRNLPPDEITGLIQAMRQRRQVASSGPSAGSEVGNDALGSAPPAYDFTK